VFAYALLHSVVISFLHQLQSEIEAAKTARDRRGEGRDMEDDIDDRRQMGGGGGCGAFRNPKGGRRGGGFPGEGNSLGRK
jgi:hypothetical protein